MVSLSYEHDSTYRRQVPIEGDWRGESLHPLIQVSILNVLRHNPPQFFNYVTQSYREPVTTVKAKLELLQKHKDKIVREFLATPRSGIAHSEAEKLRVSFWVVKTVTFETSDGENSGLATILVENDRPLSTAEKTAILTASGYVTEPNRKKKEELVKAGVRVITNKETDGLKIGAHTHVDLEKLGTSAGAVGPWQLPGSKSPIYIFRPDDQDGVEREYQETEMQIFDFALSSHTSLLVYDTEQTMAFIERVAHILGITDSVQILQIPTPPDKEKSYKIMTKPRWQRGQSYHPGVSEGNSEGDQSQY